MREGVKWILILQSEGQHRTKVGNTPHTHPLPFTEEYFLYIDLLSSDFYREVAPLSFKETSTQELPKSGGGLC